MEDRKPEHGYFSQHVEEAIRSGWIHIYYMPVIRTITGQITSFECLARWKDPVYGLVMPGMFIPELEQSGKAALIDLAALEDACSHIRERRQNGEEEVSFSINISPWGSDGKKLAGKAGQIVSRYQVDPSLINLEVNGRSGNKMAENEMSSLASAIHQEGFNLSVDILGDYDRGGMSGQDLKDLDVSSMKINLMVMKPDSEITKAMIQSLIRLNRQAGGRTLAVGVEGQDELDYLKSIGCERIEGYCTLAPMEYDDCIRSCRQKNLVVEKRKLSGAYDTAEKSIDFLSGRASALLEFDGARVRYLTANSAFLEENKKLGYDSLKQLEEQVNRRGSQLGTFLSRRGMLMSEGTVEQLNYTAGEHEVNLEISLVSSGRGLFLYAESMWITRASEIARRDQIQELLYTFLRTYMASFFVLNLTKESVQSVERSSGHHLEITRESLHDFAARQAQRSIREDERAEFLSFLNLRTLPSRCARTENGRIGSVFHTRTDDGSFEEMLHVAACRPGAGEDLVYYAVFPGHYEVVNGVPKPVPETKKTASDAGILSSPSELTSSLASLAAGYRKDLADFTMILMDFDGLRSRMAKEEKEKRQRDLTRLEEAVLLLAGAELGSTRSGQLTCGVFESWFVVLTSCTQREKILSFVAGVEERIGERAEARRYLASEEDVSFEDLYTRLLSHLFEMPDRQEMLPARKLHLDPDTFESLTAMLDHLAFGCAIWDSDRKIAFWNREAENLTGYPRQEMTGSECSLFGERCFAGRGNTLCRIACPFEGDPSAESGERHVIFCHRDGYHIQLKVSEAPVREKNGAVTAVMVLFSKEGSHMYTGSLIQGLVDAANIDPLTGLVRRSYVDSFLSYRFGDYQRYGSRFAVLFTDIDQFGSFNNVYGHEAGDAVLRAFGEALRGNVRDTDCCGRWGGDEFIAVINLPGDFSLTSLATRFSSISDSVMTTYNGQELKIHFSIGITAVRPGDTEESITRRADEYMYLAKKSQTLHIVTDENADACRKEEQE
jgi:two-component system cell cycle response regulator